MSKKKSVYSVHPGFLITQKRIGELKQKTGRTLEEWLKHIKKDGPSDEKERRVWLKDTYGLGPNTAWWLAERSVGKGAEAGDPVLYLEFAERDVEKMFFGGRAHDSSLASQSKRITPIAGSSAGAKLTRAESPFSSARL